MAQEWPKDDHVHDFRRGPWEDSGLRRYFHTLCVGCGLLTIGYDAAMPELTEEEAMATYHRLLNDHDIDIFEFRG